MQPTADGAAPCRKPIPREACASARLHHTHTAEPRGTPPAECTGFCRRPLFRLLEVRLSDPSQLFRSFWMGGFEGACHINRSQHAARPHRGYTTRSCRSAADYRLVKSAGLADRARWRPLATARHAAADTTSHRSSRCCVRRSPRTVQVIWTLCHYGWPDDLDVFSAAWVDRFARYCGAVARVVADHTDEVPFYSPINEISFLCWAAGDIGGFIHPHARGRGNELKRQLGARRDRRNRRDLERRPARPHRPCRPGDQGVPAAQPARLRRRTPDNTTRASSRRGTCSRAAPSLSSAARRNTSM